MKKGTIIRDITETYSSIEKLILGINTMAVMTIDAYATATPDIVGVFHAVTPELLQKIKEGTAETNRYRERLCESVPSVFLNGAVMVNEGETGIIVYGDYYSEEAKRMSVYAKQNTTSKAKEFVEALDEIFDEVDDTPMTGSQLSGTTNNGE